MTNVKLSSLHIQLILSCIPKLSPYYVFLESIEIYLNFTLNFDRFFYVTVKVLFNDSNTIITSTSYLRFVIISNFSSLKNLIKWFDELNKAKFTYLTNTNSESNCQKTYHLSANQKLWNIDLQSCAVIGWRMRNCWKATSNLNFFSRLSQLSHLSRI